MTPEELQEVVAAVIAALKTNGKTIDQLTAVTSLADTDNLEISNGKKVSFGKLKELVAAAVTVSAEEIKGWEMIESTDDLPEDPTQAQQEKAYVIADTSTMYVYVGYGGDTLDGLYQSLNMKGEDGAPGPPGADGHDGVDLGEVALVNNLTEGGEESALSAEMGKTLREAITTVLGNLGEYAFPNGKPTIDWTGGTAGIFLTLSDVTSSNTDTSIDVGDAYTTTLTGAHSSNNLYVMDVVIKMNGVDITSTAYNANTGVVSIAEVTGSIEITASEFTYVSDGLVLHLDGKNRGGTSGHWVSLVDYNGTPIDFTLTNCDETHDSYVAGNGTTSKGIGSVDTLDISPTTGTIEALYDGAQWNNDTLAILHNRGSSTVNHIGLTSWHSAEYGENNLLTIAMGTKLDDSSKVGAKYPKTTIIGGGLVSCLYNSFLINDTEPVAGSYVGSTQSADSTSMLSIFYRKTSANERYFKLNLYSIRVYNRHLTDAERAQNKRVDQKRFNII